MRVYIKFAGHAEFPPHEVKIKLPASWIASGKVEQILSLFLDAYNKKFPGRELEPGQVSVLSHQDQVLPITGAIKDGVKEYDELKVVFAAMAAAAAPAVACDAPAVLPGSLMCRNYGCGKRYLPDENTSSSCSHHSKPPIFRETLKSWSCCPDRTAWDWDGFKALPTCTTGPHCPDAPKDTFAASPTVAMASTAAAADDRIRSIDEFNKSNPDAVTAASAAVASAQAARTVATRRASDGRVRCVHEGCKKWFLDSADSGENGPAACVYHRQGPTFHEGKKFWSCCPQTQCTEFDEFLAVPGCATGPHEAAGTVGSS